MSGIDRMIKAGKITNTNLLSSGGFQDIFFLGSSNQYAAVYTSLATRALTLFRVVGNDAPKVIKQIATLTANTTCRFTFDGMFYHVFEYTAVAGTYKKLDRNGKIVYSFDTSGYFGPGTPLSPNGVAFVDNCIVVTNGTGASATMRWLNPVNLKSKRIVALTGSIYYNGLHFDGLGFWTNYNNTVTPSYQLRKLDQDCKIVYSITHPATGGKGANGITSDGVALVTAN